MYTIVMGIPQMQNFWNDLCSKIHSGFANKDDILLHKKIGKALAYIARDPRHPGLQTHEIEALSKRFGAKVWQSYLENNTPAAGRIYWVYGPDRGYITIVGIEPHPNDKSNSYNKITLSLMGEIV